MLKDKRAEEKYMSFWWIAMVVFASVGIFLGIGLAYSSDIDVRELETNVLHTQILDCITEDGFLIDDFGSDFDIVQECNFDLDAEKFYFSVGLYDETTASVEVANVDSFEDVILYVRDNAVTYLDTNRKCNCGVKCEEYAQSILKYAEEYVIDPFMILAIMMQESSCRQDAASSSSVGLMQINLGAHCGDHDLPKDQTECKYILINNADKNIEVGADILKGYYDLSDASYERKIKSVCKNEVYRDKYLAYTGWAQALRLYNGPGCNPVSARIIYVEEIYDLYNKLRALAGDAESKKKVVELGIVKGPVVFEDKSIDYEMQCKLQESAEVTDGAVCLEKEDAVLYYDEGEVKKGVLKFLIASNNEGGVA